LENSIWQSLVFVAFTFKMFNFDKKAAQISKYEKFVLLNDFPDLFRIRNKIQL